MTENFNYTSLEYLVTNLVAIIMHINFIIIIIIIILYIAIYNNYSIYIYILNIHTIVF